MDEGAGDGGGSIVRRCRTRSLPEWAEPFAGLKCKAIVTSLYEHSHVHYWDGPAVLLPRQRLKLALDAQPSGRINLLQCGN